VQIRLEPTVVPVGVHNSHATRCIITVVLAILGRPVGVVDVIVVIADAALP
jgi:hypothetical protein